MNTSLVSRRWVLGAAAASGAALHGLPARSIASAEEIPAESFLQSNLDRIPRLISDTNGDQVALGSMLSTFIAFDRIGVFVLGRYAAAVRSDRSLRDEWEAAFRNFAIANYAVRLERFQGRVHRVTGSVVRSPDRDVIVYSEVRGGSGYDTIRLGWRVLRNEGAWTVFDLSVRLDAGEIWLAQQQQAEILSALDRNGGDLPALIDDIRRVTARIATPSARAPA